MGVKECIALRRICSLHPRGWTQARLDNTWACLIGCIFDKVVKTGLSEICEAKPVHHVESCQNTSCSASTQHRKFQKCKQTNKIEKEEDTRSFQTACFKHMILLWEMIFNDMTLDAANWNRIRKCLYLGTSWMGTSCILCQYLVSININFEGV